MADAGYSLDTQSTSGAQSQGGTATGGTTGSVFYNNSKGVPVWLVAVIGVVVLAIFFAPWRRKK